MEKEELIKLFNDKYEYNPETGVVIYKTGSYRKTKGQVAGTRSKGYFVLTLDKNYQAHRLIFLIMTGDWPKGVIDHKDGDGFNNKWENLRDTNQVINGRNKKLPKNNTSGYRGVSWVKRENRWQVHIAVNKKMVYIGLFDLLEDAILARVDAEMRYWGGSDREIESEFDK